MKRKLELDEKRGDEKRLRSTMTKDEKKREYEREKKRKQREKIYADPELHAQFLSSKKRSNEKAKNKKKKIADMTEEDQEVQRLKWKHLKRKQRKLQKSLQKDESSTSAFTNSKKSPYQIAGARKARKNRTLHKKRIDELEKDKLFFERKANKYKKR